jgi:hypothetical protein
VGDGVWVCVCGWVRERERERGGGDWWHVGRRSCPLRLQTHTSECPSIHPSITCKTPQAHTHTHTSNQPNLSSAHMHIRSIYSTHTHYTPQIVFRRRVQLLPQRRQPVVFSCVCLNVCVRICVSMYVCDSLCFYMCVSECV